MYKATELRTGHKKRIASEINSRQQLVVIIFISS